MPALRIFSRAIEVAFSAAQPKRNVDGAGLCFARLLGDLSKRRGAIVNLDLHPAVGFRFELLGPRLDDIELEEAGRSEKMAELDRNRLRMALAAPDAMASTTASRHKIRARIALSLHEKNLYPENQRMHVLRFSDKASPKVNSYTCRLLTCGPQSGRTSAPT
jgi:hypothetical protein